MRSGMNVDAVDDPADLGFPVNGLQNAARGRGGDHVVGDAVDLHLRPCKAGEIAADMEFDAVGHGSEKFDGIEMVEWVRRYEG